MNDHEFTKHAELEDTHWWFRARRNIIIDRFRHALAPSLEKHVVEIGCGTGGNLKELSRYYSTMGIDVSAQAVRYARNRVTATVELGDFRDVLRDSWGRIDGVLLADVLEHVADDRRFLERLISALKPGAVLVITVPAFHFLWSGHDVALGHVRRYQIDELRTLWNRLAVKELFCSYFNCLLFPPIALARLLMGSGAPQKQSSLKPANRMANAVLAGVFGIEKHLLRRVRLPFGVSLIAVLEKRQM